MRNCGGPFFFGDVLSQVPHLTVEDRVQYLVDKGYSKGNPIGDRVRQFLPHANFHHFLGYARNYGRLVAEDRVELDPSLDAVVSIIETDQRISAILYRAFQSYEHQLRSLLVDAHCGLFPSYECFFADSHYEVRNLERGNPSGNVVTQTLRMKEPYVAGRLERYMRDNGLKGRPDDLVQPHRNAAVEQFPIWAIVDGLTFGTLADLILTTRPAGTIEDPKRIMDVVAAGSSVHRSVFESQLHGLLVLRNLIAHHARLWMRPMPQTPAKPKLFERACRDMDHKSMYVAWLTLASHLRDRAAGRALALELDEILDAEPVYRAGVQLPRPPKS